MSTQPLVSFVVPVHNAVSSVGFALSSILGQSYSNFEAVVVDDGSTDSTADIVAAYTDPRVRLFRKRQGGPSSARNLGIREAKGEYIAFLDDDDILFPTYLDDCVNIMRSSSGRSIVTSNAYYLFPTGRISDKVTFHSGELPKPARQLDHLLRSNFVCIMSVIPKKVFDQVGLFDEALGRAEDWDLWLRAALNGWTFVHSRKPGGIINRTVESQSSSVELVANHEQLILAKCSDSGLLNQVQEEYVAERLRLGSPSVLMTSSSAKTLAGNYRAAASDYSRAVSLQGFPKGTRVKAILFRSLPGIVGPIRRRAMESR